MASAVLSPANMSEVVIDNLLCYLTCKLNIIRTEELVHLCASTFNEDEVRESRDTLNEMCDNKSRMIKRQGPKMVQQTLEDMIKLLHEKGEGLPPFAAVDLNRLPPVTIKSLDVSVLLTKLEKNETEVRQLTESLQKQAEINENLRMGLSSLGKRMQDIENNIASTGHQVTPVLAGADSDITHVKTVFDTTHDDQGEDVARVTNAPPSGDKLFSEMVKKLGEWQTQQRRPNKRKTQGITGAAKTDLKIVKPLRLANVFASRFDPDITAEQLTGYLQKETKLTVQVEKVKTKFDTYSSFHIKCRCEKPEIFMDENLWPEKAYVRWWREKKTKGGTSNGELAVLQNESETEDQ